MDITPQELSGVGCSSDKDLVTFVDWIDSSPSVFINFIAKIDKPGRLNCYDGDSLKTWLTMRENIFAKWVPNDDVKGMNDMGYGGHPDLNELFVKLYTGEYLVYDENVKLLKKGLSKPVKFDANFIDIKRIGNIQGTFGVGDTHGQVPGYGIYRLKLLSKIDENDIKDLDSDNEITEYQDDREEDDDMVINERSYDFTRGQWEDEEYYMDFSESDDTESSEMIPDSLFENNEEEIPYSPYRPPQSMTRPAIRNRRLPLDYEPLSSSEDEMDIDYSDQNTNNNPLPPRVTLPIVKAKSKVPPLPPPKWVPAKAKMKM